MDKEERLIDQDSLMDLLQTALERGASVPLHARGCSMAPFIKNGDVLTLSPLSSQKPRQGDVVACRLPKGNKLVIHRVIKAAEGGYLIPGDYCPELDGSISREAVLGLVNRVDRVGNRVRIGLTAGKTLIAFLSAADILYPLLSFLYRRLNTNARLGSEYQAI